MKSAEIPATEVTILPPELPKEQQPEVINQQPKTFDQRLEEERNAGANLLARLDGAGFYPDDFDYSQAANRYSHPGPSYAGHYRAQQPQPRQQPQDFIGNAANSAAYGAINWLIANQLRLALAATAGFSVLFLGSLGIAALSKDLDGIRAATLATASGAVSSAGASTWCVVMSAKRRKQNQEENQSEFF